MLVFGLNQMLDPNYWVGYVPTFVRHFLPMPVTTFMHIHALGNITLGILLLLGIWKKIITWLTLVWWLTIVPAAFLKQWDIGMRDLVISLTLVSYIWLIYQTADR